MSNPFGQLLLNEMHADMLNAKTNLLEKMERSKLPEALFRKHFLGWFIGEVEATAENSIVASWIGIAGSPTSEVEIIDAGGRVLFIAPAILSSRSLNVHQESHSTVSFKKILQTVNEEYLTPVANNLLYKGIQGKMADIIQPIENDPIEVAKWEALYSFYKIKHTPVSQQNRHSTSIEEDEIVGYS